VEVSRKRQADLTPAQKAKLLVEYANLPSCHPASRYGWLEGCCRCAVQQERRQQELFEAAPGVNVLASPDNGDPFARAERSDKGVPKKLTPTKDAAMKEQAAEWGNDFAYQEMADTLMDIFDLQISAQAIADHLRKTVLRRWSAIACALIWRSKISCPRLCSWPHLVGRVLASMARWESGASLRSGRRCMRSTKESTPAGRRVILS